MLRLLFRSSAPVPAHRAPTPHSESTAFTPPTMTISEFIAGPVQPSVASSTPPGGLSFDVTPETIVNQESSEVRAPMASTTSAIVGSPKDCETKLNLLNDILNYSNKGKLLSDRFIPETDPRVKSRIKSLRWDLPETVRPYLPELKGYFYLSFASAAAGTLVYTSPTTFTAAFLAQIPELAPFVSATLSPEAHTMFRCTENVPVRILEGVLERMSSQQPLVTATSPVVSSSSSSSARVLFAPITESSSSPLAGSDLSTNSVLAI